ncbi:hypothetical protein [Rhizobium tumorigenes]|uniref:hypothetical protein n=1 Tax=Rhizobium tumorigenes TaxID=2041385 RepID=UPI00241F24B0|nr:hypothetical protein [Rhizobium tumorigenes]WFS03492.1 hypothetical protein PR016_19605 [Rhizobium tumorigenes]
MVEKIKNPLRCFKPKLQKRDTEGVRSVTSASAVKDFHSFGDTFAKSISPLRYGRPMQELPSSTTCTASLGGRNKRILSEHPDW